MRIVSWCLPTPVRAGGWWGDGACARLERSFEYPVSRMNPHANLDCIKKLPSSDWRGDVLMVWPRGLWGGMNTGSLTCTCEGCMPLTTVLVYDSLIFASGPVPFGHPCRNHQLVIWFSGTLVSWIVAHDILPYVQLLLNDTVMFIRKTGCGSTLSSFFLTRVHLEM